MLIYNTSFHVQGEKLIPQFLKFMNTVYIPRALKGGYFSNPKFVRIMTSIGDDLYAYSFMCEVDGVANLKRWKEENGTELESLAAKEFGEKVLLFSTPMNVLNIDCLREGQSGLSAQSEASEPSKETETPIIDINKNLS